MLIRHRRVGPPERIARAMCVGVMWERSREDDWWFAREGGTEGGEVPTASEATAGLSANRKAKTGGPGCDLESTVGGGESWAVSASGLC